jgi:hypothetical protein
MPLDMPVLQQPCAASGRVYSAADCAVSERICSATALAASGRVFKQRSMVSLDYSVLSQEVFVLQQLFYIL